MSDLTDLQLAIMRVLWERGQATVTETHEALRDERGLAPTTVATLLSRLEKRGLVTHRAEGRQFVYAPRVSEAEIRQSMVDALARRLFDGDLSELVHHLIAEREIAPGDLARVRALIERATREEAPDDV